MNYRNLSRTAPGLLAAVALATPCAAQNVSK
jgi:hypothetical protein